MESWQQHQDNVASIETIVAPSTHAYAGDAEAAPLTPNVGWYTVGWYTFVGGAVTLA